MKKPRPFGWPSPSSAVISQLKLRLINPTDTQANWPARNGGTMARVDCDFAGQLLEEMLTRGLRGDAITVYSRIEEVKCSRLGCPEKGVDMLRFDVHQYSCAKKSQERFVGNTEVRGRAALPPEQLQLSGGCKVACLLADAEQSKRVDRHGKTRFALGNKAGRNGWGRPSCTGLDNRVRKGPESVAL